MRLEEEKDFFNDLCRGNYERIFRYLLVKVHDYEAAQDLLQNVFLVAWEKRYLLAEHPNPVGFLYLTARNKALTYLRQQKNSPLPLEEDEVMTVTVEPWEILERRRDKNIDENIYVASVVNLLSEPDRELYEKYYLRSQPVKTIAAAAGISETAVRMRLLRLRQRVKKIVKTLF